MKTVAVSIVLALIAATLTGVIRANAKRLTRIDIPNERSMHASPTPRGGGLAFVATILPFVAWQTARGELAPNLGFAILGGGSIVALVGFLDDRYTLPDRVRLPLWFCAAIWAVALLRGLPRIDVGFATVSLGVLGAILSVVAVVWMINLYNFMDGIDGIAGIEAVVVALAAGWLLLDPGLASLAHAVAASVFGFLAWNWPPARIFMGDAGSGFLGFLFGVLAIASERTGAMPLLAWGILLAVFLVDSTFTVGRRVVQGEKWYSAHRDHAYQIAARRAGHLPVTVSVLVIDIILVVLAAFTLTQPWALLPALGIAVATLGLVWAIFVRDISRASA